MPGLTQVLADGTNTYLYGKGRIAQYGASGAAYFLGDALGSVRQLTDATGAVTMIRSYQPYGEDLSSLGTVSSNYGFTGEWDSVNDLIYLRARYYASEMGRFLTRDPWQGSYTKPLSLNKWNYVESNPILLLDRTGLSPFFCGENEHGEPVFCDETQQAKNYSEKAKPLGIKFNPEYDRLWRGALGIEHGKNAAQIINDSAQEYESSKHVGDYHYNNNLCGQVSIAAILASIDQSISVQDVLRAYEANVVEELIGQDSNVDQLYALRNNAYSSYLSFSGSLVTDLIPELIGHVWYNKDGLKLFAQRIKEKLNQGYLFLVTVKINGNSGKIGWQGGTPHWVVITGVSDFNYDETKPPYYGTGEDYFSPLNWVRVYNPFDNETEYYTYEDFRNSWHASGNISIIVKPGNKHPKPDLPRFCKSGTCCN